MGFSVPNPFGVNPQEGDELFKKAWEVFGDNVIEMMNAGWDATLVGKSDVANKYFQGANIYFYMIFTAQAARQKLSMLGILDEGCNSSAIDEEYGLSCIEENLVCLSTHFDQDYRSAWDEVMEIFGIDRNTDACDDCCLGIGEMVVDHEDDCLAWIIGGCSDIDGYTPETEDDSFGEFALGQFALNEFTNFNEE